MKERHFDEDQYLEELYSDGPEEQNSDHFPKGIYYRKTTRHNWLIAGCAVNQADLDRQLYHLKKDAPGWIIATIDFSPEQADQHSLGNMVELRPGYPNLVQIDWSTSGPAANRMEN